MKTLSLVFAVALSCLSTSLFAQDLYQNLADEICVCFEASSVETFESQKTFETIMAGCFEKAMMGNLAGILDKHPEIMQPDKAERAGAEIAMKMGVILSKECSYFRSATIVGFANGDDKGAGTEAYALKDNKLVTQISQSACPCFSGDKEFDFATMDSNECFVEAMAKSEKQMSKLKKGIKHSDADFVVQVAILLNLNETCDGFQKEFSNSFAEGMQEEADRMDEVEVEVEDADVKQDAASPSKEKAEFDQEKFADLLTEESCDCITKIDKTLTKKSDFEKADTDLEACIVDAITESPEMMSMLVGSNKSAEDILDDDAMAQQVAITMMSNCPAFMSVIMKMDTE